MKQLLATPLFAVVIAIDKYDEPLESTAHRINDAKKVCDFLDKSLSVPSSHVKRLLGDNATRKCIIDAISSLGTNGDIEKDDAILVYYAGMTGQEEGSEAGMICPADVLRKLPGAEGEADGQVTGISVTELKTWLNQVANAKGKNITVVIDADTSSFKWGYPPSFVALSRETSCEDHEEGIFTDLLLRVIGNVQLDAITYRGLAEAIEGLLPPSITERNIYCEGSRTDRLLFNPNSIAHNTDDSLILGYRTDEKIIVNAGSAHGVVRDATFGLYRSNLSLDSNKEVQSLIVVQVDSVSSTVKPTRQAEDVPHIFYVKAKRVPPQNIRIYCDTMKVIGDVISSFEASRIGIEQVLEQDNADILLSPKGDIFALQWNEMSPTFPIRRPIEFPRSDCNFRAGVQKADLPTVLQAAARFKYILVNVNSPMTEKEVSVELNEVEYTWRSFDGEAVGPNLLSNERADLKMGEDRTSELFGLKITNNLPTPIHLQVLYFQAEDLMIRGWHSPDLGTKAPLRSDDSLEVGYGDSKRDPFGFIVPEGLAADVGWFKLFITTSPTNLSSLFQQPPFNTHDNYANLQATDTLADVNFEQSASSFIVREGRDTRPKKRRGLWGTRVLTIVQRALS